MAVWQFVIDFVPEWFLLEFYGCIPEASAFQELPEFDYFTGLSIPVKEVLPYLQQLGTIEDWTRDSIGFQRYRGEADNDISVCFDAQTGCVTSLDCRIDLRQPTEAFIYGILTLAVDFDCLLSARRNQLFAPTVPALRQAMATSNARRFVDDPLKFLNDLSRRNTDSPPAD